MSGSASRLWKSVETREKPNLARALAAESAVAVATSTSSTSGRPFRWGNSIVVA